MSRRKHLLQSLDQEVEPPGEGQHIVRALGSRGSNIIEVEFPDGRSTLCLLPAKFHKKLWVKNGNYLIVEDVPEAAGEGSRVTGQILAVLFVDHVKQLKRMPGVWPPEFDSSSGSASQAADQLAALGLADSDNEGQGGSEAAEQQQAGGAAAAGAAGGASAVAAVQAAGQEGLQAAWEAGGGGEEGDESGGGYYSSGDDDLPPIPKFNNRKVIEYEVSDSDSDDE